MRAILIPGRHHLLTKYQHDFLAEILNKEDFDTIIWAVTSANHSNTRRNPIPGNRREVAIETFSADIKATTYVYMIDDIGNTPKFAEYTLKKIETESGGLHKLTPKNTVVAVSTPGVIKMYKTLGFEIFPLELESEEPEKYHTPRAWELIEGIYAAHMEGKDWKEDKDYLKYVSSATQNLFSKYNYGELIITLFSDPVLGSDGDLTDTRNYSDYIRAFDDGAKRKYQLVKDYIKPGRIVDVGCGTGGILKQISQDEQLRESDLFGVEVSRKLFVLCENRKENGEFENDNVFFYQRNIVEQKVFPNDSINTFTSFSLTHELKSYSSEEALKRFLKHTYDQLIKGGVYVNFDVVGPDDKDKEVYLKLNVDDGENEGWDKEFDEKQGDSLISFLDSLSTQAKFKRFAKDFRKEEGYTLNYREESIDNELYFVMRFLDAAEFLSKKGYTDNWYSEMHETFCYWSFEDWKKALSEVGFKVTKESKTYTNEWIVENWYKPTVGIFGMEDGKLISMEYPPTNVILVAEKV